MQRNNLMLSNLLKVYHPEEKGLISATEMELIVQALCLEEMDLLQLRNLRDYTVLFLTRNGNDTTMEDWDRMSAIVCAIDHYIWKLGGEV